MTTPFVVDVRLGLDRFELAVELSAKRPVTGVFGASGSGKTSLLETVAGLRPKARGRIALGDEVWLDSAAGVALPPEARHVGYVPQDGLLFPHMNVRENLLAGHRRARRAGREVDLRRVTELLELGPLLQSSVTTLSGGERQRVALGRALCSGPRLLLLDEPLASLDLPLRRRLLPLLRRVREELTVPMLLVSHDPIEVQALCDEIVVLHDGRKVARGEPREVLRDPRVFPLAEAAGFENVLPGRLVESGEATSRVRLDGGGVEVVALRSDLAPGNVLLGLAADEILIATEEPRGLSALNVLPAKILEIRPLTSLVLVTAELEPGIPPLLLEIAETTPAKMGLTEGGRVFLVFKAASCRLYGAPSSSLG